jgi:hypothetical protein
MDTKELEVSISNMEQYLLELDQEVCLKEEKIWRRMYEYHPES